MRKLIRRMAAIAIATVAVMGSLVASATASNAYIGYLSESFVSVFDTKTNAVFSTISAANTLRGIAITPDGSRAYLTGTATDSVYVIDTHTNISVGAIPIENPIAIAITPDGRRAYVTSGTIPGSVSVIDTQTNAVAGAAINVGLTPAGIAITPNGGSAYVTNNASGSVSVIDTQTNTVVGGAITVGASPWGIAITPDGSRAYVARDVKPGSVSVIDTQTNTVAGAIALGAGAAFPIGIAIAPSGARAYATNLANVSAIDTKSNGVVGAPIVAGARPSGIAITPDGGRAFVLNHNSDDISVIDVATNTTVGAPIAVGKQPEAIAITPDQPPRAGLSTRGNGLRVAVTGSASSDPDGAVATYSWDFGDGMSAQTTVPTADHTYQKVSKYRVLLTVSDGEGCPGFIFTGQTASCNGPSTASVDRLLVTAKMLKLKHNTENGTAIMRVRVPGKVIVDLSGKGVVRQRPRAGASIADFKQGLGTVSLPIRAKGKARRKLNRTGTAKVKVKLTVRPVGGDPNVQTKRVRLVKGTRRGLTTSR
jgi:YVTN family beta-propeller protein